MNTRYSSYILESVRFYREAMGLINIKYANGVHARFRAHGKIIFYINNIKFRMNTGQLSVKAKQARGELRKLTLVATALQRTLSTAIKHFNAIKTYNRLIKSARAARGGSVGATIYRPLASGFSCGRNSRAIKRRLTKCDA